MFQKLNHSELRTTAWLAVLVKLTRKLAFPPLAVGITVVIATPLVSVNELGLYVIPDGAASLIRMVTVVLHSPVLVAVTV